MDLASSAASTGAPARRTLPLAITVFPDVTGRIVRVGTFDLPRLTVFLDRLFAVSCSRLSGMNSSAGSATVDRETLPPEVDVVIEVPRGSFLKEGSTGRIDFVSPLPYPFNYGAVPDYLGLDGDLLDAVVLGPRLRQGTRLKLRAWGAGRRESGRSYGETP